MVWFTETLAILKDRCKTESRSNSETSDTHVPRPPPFKFIDRYPIWQTRRVKEAIHMRLYPNNNI